MDRRGGELRCGRESTLLEVYNTIADLYPSTQNPTLQGSFAGTTTLDFQHVADTSLSLYPSTAPNDTMTAQLFYTPNKDTSITEQFYCRADTCTSRSALNRCLSNTELTFLPP